MSDLLSGQAINLTLLAATWAGAALLTQITTVLTQVLQGVSADHDTLHVKRPRMDGAAWNGPRQWS